PVDDDGRVHPDWAPAITGRWRAGKAQNWPKYISGWPPETDAEGNWKLKPSGDFICPSDNPRSIVSAPPGRVLVGADFSQLELRIVAYVAQDEFLLDIFRNKQDPHAIFARECFPDHVPNLERDWHNLTDLSLKADLSGCPPALTARLAPIQRKWS